jgi:hypothetical protein
MEENAMDTHVKVVGWLWIVNGLVSVLMLTIGLVVINWPEVIPDPQVSILATFGALCFFLPGMIADFIAGSYLLQYRAWARILAIVLGIINLFFFPFGTALGIYTLFIMFNEETEALFLGEGTSAEVEEVS